MKHLHAFESLPYEKIDELGELFFDILKKKPELYKKYLKDRKEDKFNGITTTSVDWFKHGLTNKMLKKLSHGTPSLGQAMAAQTYAFKKYKKWLKENPELASVKIANVNNKTGLFESSYEMDFLDATEVKPGMQCDISYDNLNKISATTHIFKKSHYTAEVIDVFKGSELFNLATRVKTYIANKLDKMPKDNREIRKLNVYSYAIDHINTIGRKTSSYKDKYFLLINIIEIDALKIVVYGKDDFNFTNNHEFLIPRWKIANRPILKNLNDKTGLFDE